jgi:protein disulfide isomerase
MQTAVLCTACLLSGATAFGWSSFSAGGSQKHATDELSTENFPAFMEEHPVTAILFYAPWCFYSQQVMPAWDLAAQKLMLHDPPVHLAKIDTHKHGAIGDKYRINAFPTMKLFVDGSTFEYDSRQGRGWQQIVKWVNKHIDRDHILSKVEDVDHYLHDNDLNVVGLFPDGYNSTTFAKSARHFDDIMFAEARGSAVSAQIAERLTTHAILTCETITLGQSAKNAMEVDLPRPRMDCSGTPRNPQRPEWTDSFQANVTGLKLTVKRSDNNDGWQQNLQIKCCDEESTETAVAKKAEYKISVPSVVMFMPHDERFAIYKENIEDIHSLDKWITARRTPMIMRLTAETADKLLDSGPEKTPVIFMISRQENKELEDHLREAAKLLRGRILICFSGMESQIEKRLADLAGVEEDALPVVTLVEAHAGQGPYHTSKKYRLPVQGLKPQTVVTFVEDYEGGRLKPWLKSEPAPTEEMVPGSVGMLVGTTFTQVAHDSTKDVLVNFYAPWCGHCRKFEPNYKQVARKLKHVKSIALAKIDATRNEVEGMVVQGFPTIILFAAGPSPKKQVTYQGPRTPEDMTRWLHEHCSIKFDDRPPKEEPTEDPIASGLLDPSEEDL